MYDYVDSVVANNEDDVEVSDAMTDSKVARD